jgi:hypothetical protein
MALKRTPTEREGALAKLATLYLRGQTQVEQAKALGCSQSQISRDLKTLQGRWRAASLVSLEDAKARELAKIDHLERAYWRAWKRSCKDKQVKATEKIAGGKDDERTKAANRVEGQSGNPAFLAGIERCIAKRCEILGLVAKANPEFHVTNHVTANIVGLSLEEFKRLPMEDKARLLRGG